MPGDELIDLYAAPAPGSGMRAARVHQRGRFRLSRVDSEIYSVQIVGNGSFGRLLVTDGNLEPKFRMISPFTGSFWLCAGSLGGIILNLWAATDGDVANVTVNYREIK